MFIEDLENRQMFTVTIAPTPVIPTKVPLIAPLVVASTPATAVKSAAVTAAVSLVQTAAPSQGAVIKPGANSAIGTVLQGTPDPSKPIGQTGTTTLAGGIVISNNPNSRPSAADLAAANGFAAMLESVVNSTLKDLAAQYGKTLSQLTDKTVTDPTTRTDFMSTIMAELAAQTGAGQIGTIGGIDARKADGDVPGGLGVNPTDAEVQAAIKAREQKDNAGGTTTAAPADSSTKDKAKDAAETGILYALDVAIEKYGPPGPCTTLLEAPGIVEKVTGSASDLLNGFIAIFTSGDKNPDTHPKEMTDPNGDVTLEKQQQKVIDQAMAVFNRYLNAAVLPTGTSLISQPKRGDDTSAPPVDKSLINGTGQMPQKDLSPYINPGSGDDGNVAVTGVAAPPPAKVVIKDPPNPMSDSGGTGLTPPSSGVTPVSGSTPSGTKPTTPK